MSYEPSDQILKNYADVLVKFALWGGKGINKGDVVCVSIEESAKPMLKHLQRSILEAGGHMVLRYHPEGIGRDFYELANEDQLNWMPKDFMLERLNTCDHFLSIISTNDKLELEGVDSEKIMNRSKAGKFYSDAFRDKVNKEQASWTLGLYGTDNMAEDVGMSKEEYWEQIIKACFLDEKDPIAKWQEVFDQVEGARAWLNSMDIEWLHVKGEDADLKVKIGEGREWLGGSGCNIPSFELFISPDFRGTEGWIRFDQPLYRYGNLIEGVELEFKDGKVVKSSATKNEKLLKDMIAVEGADQVGEYSLTDKRFSRITRFMGETLYDENVGGEFGNTHIAVGSAYRESYPGNSESFTEEDWDKLGYNNSVVHTDIVSTKDRTVTATLKDGSEKVIYENGMFTMS
jgi:aminopeptidase